MFYACVPKLDLTGTVQTNLGTKRCLGPEKGPVCLGSSRRAPHAEPEPERRSCYLWLHQSSTKTAPAPPVNALERLHRNHRFARLRLLRYGGEARSWSRSSNKRAHSWLFRSPGTACPRPNSARHN